MDEFELIRAAISRAWARERAGRRAGRRRRRRAACACRRMRTWRPRSIPSSRAGISRRTADARSIGHRALAVNLSDMAAMGATPAWATLALTLPGADADWLEGFARGFSRSRRCAWRRAGRRRHHRGSADRQRADHGTRRSRHGAAPRRRAGGRSSGGDRHPRRSGAGLALATRCARDARMPRRRANSLARFEYPTPRVAVRRRGPRPRERGDGLVGRSGGRSAEARGRERARRDGRGRAAAVVARVAGGRAARSRRAIGRSAPAMTTNCSSRCRREHSSSSRPEAAPIELKIDRDR